MGRILSGVSGVSGASGASRAAWLLVVLGLASTAACEKVSGVNDLKILHGVDAGAPPDGGGSGDAGGPRCAGGADDCGRCLEAACCAQALACSGDTGCAACLTGEPGAGCGEAFDRYQQCADKSCSAPCAR